MTSQTIGTTRAARGEGIFVFTIVWLLYAASSPGNLIGDSEVRWNVARSLADHGGFEVPPGSTPNAARGRDGKWYSFYGPGQSVVLVAAVAGGRAMAALPLPAGASDDRIGQFLASVVLLPLFGAAAVLLLWRIVLEASGDRRAARWVAGIFAVGTMHWQYSVNTYEESQIAFFLLGAVWAVQRHWRTDRIGYLAAAFALMGASLTFRISSAVVLLPVGVVGLAADLARHRARRLHRLGRWVLTGILCLGPFLLALGTYNFARFGSPWETGYGPAHAAMGPGIRLFETPFLEGLGGMLLSPGKSVFLYNPALLLSIAGFPALWRRHRALALAAAGAFVAVVLFHAKYTFWSGDLAWGPRYLASVMGLCCLPAATLVVHPRRKWLVAPVVAASLVVQVISLPYNFGLEYFQDRRHGTIPDAYVWRTGESQLVCRFRNIALDLAGRPAYRSTPPLQARPETHQSPAAPEAVQAMHGVNIFPFKARAVPGGARLFPILLALWAAMLLAVICLALMWRRRVRLCRFAGEQTHPGGALDEGDVPVRPR